MSDNPLAPDEIRALLRECVTVVKAGETLVVRAHENTTPGQLREMQEIGNSMIDFLGFRVLFVPGQELGVVESGAAANG